MCMCGDYYCRSCGPAQGNGQCQVCYAWSADGGCDDVKACAKEGDKQDKEMERQFRLEEKYIKQHESGKHGTKEPIELGVCGQIRYGNCDKCDEFFTNV